MSTIIYKWKWIVLRLVSMLARVKHKTLDGCSHKQWNMMFNWMILLKSYLLLNILQALHRCRQFMLWSFILSYWMNVKLYIFIKTIMPIFGEQRVLRLIGSELPEDQLCFNRTWNISSEFSTSSKCTCFSGLSIKV